MTSLDNEPTSASSILYTTADKKLAKDVEEELNVPDPPNAQDAQTTIAEAEIVSEQSPGPSDSI